jgi:hypothetical protein
MLFFQTVVRSAKSPKSGSFEPKEATLMMLSNAPGLQLGCIVGSKKFSWCQSGGESGGAFPMLIRTLEVGLG